MDNPKLRKGLNAITTSLNHLGDTFEKAFEVTLFFFLSIQDCFLKILFIQRDNCIILSIEDIPFFS